MEKLFPVNEHVVERGVRVVIGLALIGLAVAGKVGAWGYIGDRPRPDRSPRELPALHGPRVLHVPAEGRQAVLTDGPGG